MSDPRFVPAAMPWAESWRTIGVTGTNGKTSTTVMAAAVIQAAGLHVFSSTTLDYCVDGQSLHMTRSWPSFLAAAEHCHDLGGRTRSSRSRVRRWPAGTRSAGATTSGCSPTSRRIKSGDAILSRSIWSGDPDAHLRSLQALRAVRGTSTGARPRGVDDLTVGQLLYLALERDFKTPAASGAKRPRTGPRSF